jgi:GNAT superfamily N-acetyltransferase
MCVVNPTGEPKGRGRPADAVDTLTAAFERDPLYRWLFEDQATRHRALRDNFTLVIGAAHGCLDTTPDGAAASLWTAPGLTLLDNPATLLDVLSRWASPERLDAASRAMAECGRHRPVEAAILHVIGVRPDSAGAGIGSMLLRRRLAELDLDGRAVYLESSNARNHSFYLRHGFGPVASVQLGADGPSVTCMVRPPAGRS